MKLRALITVLAMGAGSFAAIIATAAPARKGFDAEIARSSQTMFEEGRKTFRADTFGSEGFWGDALRLHKAIAGEKNGGVGPGVSPKTALSVGLKVDADALPDSLKKQLKAGKVNLDDPATTIALLKLNAVVGVAGFANSDGRVKSMGITCAFCHSTVDDSFAPGIGKRLDGWALRPDGKRACTLIPPAFGLAGVNLHTWTGFGSVPYWNAYVGATEMHGSGTFFDARLSRADQYPVSARSGSHNTRGTPDRLTAKLAALHFYQLSIPAPKPPDGSFDRAASERGKALFNGK